MKKQRYVLIAGKSAKFWEVGVVGKVMTTADGRIGTKGQSTTKEFPTAAKAKNAAEKLINQKINKGYSETSVTKKTKAGKLEEIFRVEVQKLISDNAYNEYVSNDFRKKFVGLAQFPYFSIEDRIDLCMKTAESGAYDIACNPDTPPAILRKLANFYLWRVRISPAIEGNPNCPSDVREKLAYYRDDDARIADANSRKTSPAILRKLAADKDDSVREAVARNPACPTGVLKTLADNRGHHIRLAVAENSKCPAAVLRNLAEDAKEYVRQAVAKNPNCTIATLKKLGDDKDEWVRKAVSENPKCPLTLLRKFAKDEDVWTREAASANPAWPIKELEKMAGDADKWIRQGVAENSKTPVAIVRKLSFDDDADVIQCAVANPNCPVERLNALAGHKDRRIRSSVVANPQCPPTLLKKLSTDKNPDIRRNVALHPNIAPKLQRNLLSRLSPRSNWYLRYVAEDPDCPSTVLMVLATHSNRSVRVAVAGNDRCPAGALARLASDEQSLIRELVAASPNCPAEVLEKLARDPHWEVQVAVADNPVSPPSVIDILDPKKRGIAMRLAESTNCPIDTLEILAKNKDDWVRYEVACNPNCPVHILEILANDKGGMFATAAAVAEHRNCPTHVLEKLANDNDNWIRRAVATNRSSPTQLIQMLTSDGSCDVVLAALTNRKCSRRLRTKTIQSIVTKGSRAKRIGLASAWGAKWLNDAHIVETLARDSDWRVRKAVASNPSIPTSTYQTLLADEHDKVRLAAGLNVLHPFNDTMIRTQFAASPWMQVQLEKAEPKFPGITEAVKNGDYLFAAPKTNKAIRSQSLIGRIIALSQPDASPSELARASGYRDWRQRMAIARNLATPADILNKLRQDSNEHVAAQASVTLRKKGKQTIRP